VITEGLCGWGINRVQVGYKQGTSRVQVVPQH